ncbi:Uncharacterised protein [[Clostridium] sordellii]|uniref:hypothetical protein n=1 Tax=Bacillota TaxID=1239 RepID=UPI0005E09F55|nr:hypothetical protein [Paeniclostridium sordellii]CEN25110.1 Uncharacterised protein [[Clostridium] sordellii] [Paeniclostridium sordellii]CEP50449.1 Uncharacterised protein [[Clostridium] sordellii] [Paeniclostridium sordellii]
MERISKVVREEEIQEQVMDIYHRLEYISEKEPELLNYIQRTIEGLCVIKNDTIKLDNSTKLCMIRQISKIKRNKYIKILLNLGSYFEEDEKKNK